MKIKTLFKTLFCAGLVLSLALYLHYCPVKILDLEINRVDHHPLGR